MIKRFKDFIASHQLFNKDDEILLAVSGGIDSVVMLDLFARAGIKFAIAHCNFKLRLFESDDDELFVRQLAHKYMVDVFVNWCNTAEYAKKNKQSVQEAARELRYAWFEQVCEHNSFSSIAVAHHQDDNIETFFINLSRGAGLTGLKGIPVKRNNIVRPLMFATREEIEIYAKEHMLEFREDSSNSTDYYQRNKIRHHLIPRLEEISAGYRPSIVKSLNHLDDSDKLLHSVIDKKVDELFKRVPNGTKKVRISELLKLDPLCIWIFYIFNKYGFSRAVTDSLCYALKEKNYTGLKFNSQDYELLINREHILMRENITQTENNKYEITDGKLYITNPIKLNFEIHDNHKGFEFYNNRNIAYFDKEKLEFPLIVRKWQRGDRLSPFGMKGSKLVSDILIDNKVDSFTKDHVYVILSGEKIIWVVGLRSSEEYKVTNETKSIMLMQFISSQSGFDLELFKHSDT